MQRGTRLISMPCCATGRSPRPILARSSVLAARDACGPRCICAAFGAPGRFAEDPERIPHEAIVLLEQQIDIHPPTRLPALSRQASDSAIRARVREHLGLVSFAADAEARLKDRLAELTLDGFGVAELV